MRERAALLESAVVGGEQYDVDGSEREFGFDHEFDSHVVERAHRVFHDDGDSCDTAAARHGASGAGGHESASHLGSAGAHATHYRHANAPTTRGARLVDRKRFTRTIARCARRRLRQTLISLRMHSPNRETFV